MDDVSSEHAGAFRNRGGRTLCLMEKKATAIFRVSHLRVVLHVTGVERDGLQVELAVEIDRRHDVPEGGERASRSVAAF